VSVFLLHPGILKPSKLVQANSKVAAHGWNPV